MQRNRLALFLAAAAAAVLAGCVPIARTGRPTFAQQAALREVRIATWELPPLVEFTSAVRTSIDDEGQVPGEIAQPVVAALQAAIAKDLAGALADEVVRQSGAVSPGRRIVRSPLRFTERAPVLEALDPPDVATFAVRPVFVVLVGDGTPQAPVVLRAAYAATEVRAHHPDALKGSPAHLPVSFTDPFPRPLGAWLADEGRALREALAALHARGVRGLVEELTVVGVGVARGGECGGVEVAEPRNGAVLAPGAARLTWKAWEPGTAGTPLHVAYDVRAWRLDAEADVLVLSRDAVDGTSVELPALAEGALHAWTVRASISAPDGRRWTTEWSRPAPTDTWCDSGLVPARGHRFRASGDAAGPAAAPRSATRVAGGEELLPEPTPLPPRDRRLALRQLALSASGARPGTTYHPGPVRHGAHASRAAADAVGGAAACGPLLPLCLVLSLPVAAAVGAATAKNVPPPEVGEELRRALRVSAARVDVAAALARGAAGAGAGTPLRFVAAAQPRDAAIELEVVRISFVGGYGALPSVAPEVQVGGRLTLPGGEVGYRLAAVRGPGLMPLPYFVTADAAFLDRAVDAAIEEAARRVVAELLLGPDASPAPPPRDRNPSGPTASRHASEPRVIVRA